MKNESIRQKQIRAEKLYDLLSKEFPQANCHLHYKNPFQLLISTILAAQCTDERVNLVTDNLYKKYKDPQDFINTREQVLEKEIGSINFYRNKTKSIIKCCKTLIDKFNSKVPETMNELLTLPGVGRKTANVILGNCFNVPAIIVDTHLSRTSQRLGLTDSSNADKIEFELKEIVQENKQVEFSHLLGELGREICKARKPLCSDCTVSKLCPSFERCV